MGDWGWRGGTNVFYHKDLIAGNINIYTDYFIHTWMQVERDLNIPCPDRVKGVGTDACYTDMLAVDSITRQCVQQLRRPRDIVS